MLITRFCIIFLVFSLQTLSAQAPQVRSKFSTAKLGTTISVTYYPDHPRNESAIESACWMLVDSLNEIFSDYLDSSEVSQLAANAGHDTFTPVSEPLIDLIEKAGQISEESNGSFDVTIGVLTKLWRSHLSKNTLPKKREIRKALRKVDYRSIRIDPDREAVYLPLRGSSLDFGGIAKGYIGDRLAAHLESRNISRYLIDLGGDLILGDPPPNRTFWQVKIPWLNEVIQVHNCAIATSGPDYQFFVFEDKKYSHIIDPGTGWGVHQPFSATVIAPNGWQADALASVLAILSHDSSERLMERQVGVEYALGLGSKYVESAGFHKFVENISKK